MYCPILKTVLIIFALISISNVCQAGDGINIFVSPPIFELELEKGQTYNDRIYLLNKSDLSIPFEAKAINFEAIDEEGAMDFPVDTFDNPRQWFEIENPYFILEPHQSEKVEFQINVPQEVNTGGYYATILFEPKLPSYYFEDRAVKTVPEIGVLFLFSVDMKNKQRSPDPLAVVEFNIPENFHLQKLENVLADMSGLFSQASAREEKPFSIVSTSQLPFTLRLQNNDLFHIKPEGKLVVTSWTGRTVGEIIVAETTIMPGKIRRFPIEFKAPLSEKITNYLPETISNFISQNLLWGRYQAHLIMEVGDKKIDDYIIFWVFPWKAFLTTIFALAIIILMRKRIKAAAKVVLREKKFSTD